MMPLLLAALDDRDDDRTHDGSHEEEPDGRSAFHHDPMMPLLESQDARADERDEAEDEKEPRLRRLPPPVLDAIERGAEDAEERPREERLGDFAERARILFHGALPRSAHPSSQRRDATL